jgi:hypothetical protein
MIYREPRNAATLTDVGMWLWRTLPRIAKAKASGFEMFSGVYNFGPSVRPRRLAGVWRRQEWGYTRAGLTFIGWYTVLGVGGTRLLRWYRRPAIERNA